MFWTKKSIEAMEAQLERSITEADEEWLRLKDGDQFGRDYSQGIQNGLKIAYQAILDYRIPELKQSLEADSNEELFSTQSKTDGA